MTVPGCSWSEALVALDTALAELAALRQDVARITAERDTWRAKASNHPC